MYSIDNQNEKFLGELNNLGDVDVFDFAGRLTCVSGPDEDASPQCLPMDFDGDNDVDWADFAPFQQDFTGP